MASLLFPEGISFMRPSTGRESRRGSTAWYRPGAVATVQRRLAPLLLLASLTRATAQIGVGAALTRRFVHSAVTALSLLTRVHSCTASSEAICACRAARIPSNYKRCACLMYTYWFRSPLALINAAYWPLNLLGLVETPHWAISTAWFPRTCGSDQQISLI